jgi:nucleoid DNA-binding protein
MQITTYINDLLYRYECVIIPGFGALLTQYHSARIDSDTHVLFPPSKTLSFNRQLQTNDGLLANHIASVEKCSYESALQKLRTYTKKLSLQLTEGTTVSLSNIGDFYFNEENSVQFTPSSTQNFNTTSFGLSSVGIHKVSRLKETHQQKEIVPIPMNPGRRFKNGYLKYTAIAIIAVSLVSLGGMKMYEDEVQKYNFAEKQKAVTVVENQIQQATFSLENPLPTLNLTFKKQAGNYHIIAGAFRIATNADKKIKELTDIGFSPILVGVNKYGLHQVAYSSYEDRLEAIKNLREIKKSQNSDAWLLVKELEK